MNRLFPACLSLACLSAVAMTACSGPAVAATRTWQVTDFSRIRVEGPFDVQVRTGVPSGVRATGPQQQIDRIAVEQHGDTLVVHPVRSDGPGGWNWNSSEPLLIAVGTRSLAAAMLTGSGGVQVDRMTGDTVDLALSGSGDLSVGAIDTAQVKLGNTGSGDLTVAGRARTVTAILTGSGDVHGDKLAAGDATVTLTGSGDMALGASGRATVTLSGSGDIGITGPARCTVRRTGSGDVRCGHIDSGAD